MAFSRGLWCRRQQQSTDWASCEISNFFRFAAMNNDEPVSDMMLRASRTGHNLTRNPQRRCVSWGSHWGLDVASPFKGREGDPVVSIPGWRNAANGTLHVKDVVSGCDWLSQILGSWVWFIQVKRSSKFVPLNCYPVLWFLWETGTEA